MGLISDDIRLDVMNSLENEVDTVVLHRESGTYNVASGTVTSTTTVYSGTGFSQSISEEYRSEATDDISGREIVIFQPSLTDNSGNEVTPRTGDQVEHNNTKYDVVSVSQGPSASVWRVVGRS